MGRDLLANYFIPGPAVYNKNDMLNKRHDITDERQMKINACQTTNASWYFEGTYSYIWSMKYINNRLYTPHMAKHHETMCNTK